MVRKPCIPTLPPPETRACKEDRLQARSNKVGTGLGRKGIETRARLLSATKDLLQGTSPFHLTAAAIAKAAKTAPATLYVYFSDVQDILYALSVEAGDAFSRLAEDYEGRFVDHGKLEEDALDFIHSFNAIYKEHRHVLQYLSLEADRGHQRFVNVQMTNAVPLIEQLARVIKQAKPEMRGREAFADAVVLYCAMERLAGLRYQFPPDRPGPSADELDRAQARIIARHLEVC